MSRLERFREWFEDRYGENVGAFVLDIFTYGILGVAFGLFGAMLLGAFR